MTDAAYNKMIADTERRRLSNQAAMRDRTALLGEATEADEAHYAEGYAYACGYRD